MMSHVQGTLQQSLTTLLNSWTIFNEIPETTLVPLLYIVQLLYIIAVLDSFMNQSLLTIPVF